MVSVSDCLKLRKYGFKWHKDGNTDRVEAESIADCVPSVDGLTVLYKEHCALEATTATVTSIDFPDDPETHWILVNWTSIKDKRR